ncbi:MAG: hypothetical protein ACO2ZX_10445, partial [Paracoccaceae bacterium]
GEEIELVPFLMAAVHGSAFIAFVYGISILAAVILSEQIKVAAGEGTLGEDGYWKPMLQENFEATLGQAIFLFNRLPAITDRTFAISIIWNPK